MRRATLTGAVAIGALLVCGGPALAAVNPPMPPPMFHCADECYPDPNYTGSLKNWASSFKSWATSPVAQAPLPQVPSNTAKPTVVAKAEGALLEGRLEIAIACAAKSNQLTPAATVISGCYTTNGVGAPGSATPGPATVTEKVGAGAFQAFSVCVSAYSIDTSGVSSETTTACAPAVSADANAAQIAVVAQ